MCIRDRLVLEKNEEEIQNIIENMQEDYKKDNRGIEIIKIEDEMCIRDRF